MTPQISRGRTAEEREYYSFSRRVYAVFAYVYDAVAFPIRKLRHEVANIVDLAPGARVLDVATGTGQQAFAFAEKAREVVGIDLSDAMLRIAQRKNRFRNVSFRQADAAELPFEDDGFDASCVSFALHEMPSSVRQRVVREMARVTKPGGSITVVDYGLPRSQMASALTFTFVKVYERDSYAGFVKSDWRALLEEAGVEVLDDRPALRGMARVMTGRKAGAAGRAFSGAAE
jgi:demethylmenaquinone methyltransferase/2-methoxy-6-polyprenyl-1,4-benzoquinol methylase